MLFSLAANDWKREISINFTVPILLYATEGVSLSRSDSNHLSKCWNVLWKIFNVNDINCLNDTRKYFGYLAVDVEIDSLLERLSFYHS